MDSRQRPKRDNIPDATALVAPAWLLSAFGTRVTRVVSWGRSPHTRRPRKKRTTGDVQYFCDERRRVRRAIDFNIPIGQASAIRAMEILLPVMGCRALGAQA
jgi:hypothetical protein